MRCATFTAAYLVLASGPALASPLDGVTRVCLHAPELPIADAAGDPRTADLQRRLVEALRVAGFTVSDPSAVDAAVERVADRDPGVVDPYTGRPDPQRVEARRTAISEALAAEFGCEVRMAPAVEHVSAHFRGGVAYWDRRSDQVNTKGRTELNTWGGNDEYGFAPALSLWLRVLDLRGEEIAFRSAGIEVLGRLAAWQRPDLVPDDRWLRDGAKLDAAIALALGANGSALRAEGNPHWDPPSP